MNGRRALAILFVLAVAAACATSCDDQPTPQPCTNVPEGGCPLSHGIACEDPSCEAVYKCLENDTWELDHTCPPRSPASPVDAAADAEDADADGPARDASIDAPDGAFGGPGCPALEPPDCPAGFALSCPSGCCDCEDLFVCRDGGWDHWGTCGAGGITTP